MPTTKFCRISDVQALLGSDWAGDNTAIAKWIDIATAMVRQYTRRKWERAVYTEYFSTYDVYDSGRGGPLELFLGEYPVLDTPAPVIKYSQTGDFGNVEPVSDPYTVDYGQDRATMIKFYLAGVRGSARSLQIVYTAGYLPSVAEGETDVLVVDSVLSSATAIQAAFLHKRNLDNETGASSKSNKKGTIKYTVSPATGLIMEVQAMLKTKVKLLVGR